MKNHVAFGFLAILVIVALVFFYDELMAEELVTTLLYAIAVLFGTFTAGYIFGAAGSGN